MLQGVFSLCKGTFSSQLITFVSLFFLTRLYTVEAFGAFAVTMAQLTLFGVFASFRLELALALESEEMGARGVLFLGLCCCFFLAFPLAFFFGGALACIFFFQGAASLFTHYLARAFQFDALASVRFRQSVLQSALQLCFGYWKLDEQGLFLGLFVGQLYAALTLYQKSRLKNDFPLDAQFLFSLVKKHRHFLQFTMPNSLLNTLSLQFPPLVLSFFFPVSCVGSFSLAMRALNFPQLLLGQAIGQVFYAKVGRESSTEKGRALLQEVGSYSLAFSLFFFGLAALYSPCFFPLIFGAAWEMAGELVPLLAPWFCLSFVVSPLSSFAQARGAHKKAFFLSLYELILRVVFVFFGLYFKDFRLTVALLSFSGVLISLFFFTWLLSLSGSCVYLFLRASLAKLFPCVALFPLILVFYFFFSPLISLHLSLGTAILYAFYQHLLAQKGHYAQT